MPELAEDLNQIAIIGMAGRFPGAPDVETFWDNLEKGRETISFLTDDELVKAGVSPALTRQPNYVKAKGVLENGDLFDAGFFGYNPREAEIMDPQHRVFLECAWEALESAGCDPYAFAGRIGLFAGASLNSYLLFNLAANKAAVASAGEFQTLIANDKDFLATRVSYKLDLKGPSVTVQTACSTSLTAVHLACQSLLNGECDIALAGGVSVTVPLKSGYVYEKGGIISPDGHCRAFDADASGTVGGNGVGIVVLRRLTDARENGDELVAVVRATAINNDGALKVGYTAPSVNGQAEVIAEALAVANVDPATIGYIEAHGTGTALGDPIEIAALTRVFREYTQDKGFCAIGSVKSNVGHLDAAAGVTGLIKAALALKHEAIPATLNFTRPNPEFALETSPFFINAELRPWPRREVPRRAGVSSFGIGGTNVHVLLEEAPIESEDRRRALGSEGPADATRPVYLLPLSARTPAALADSARRLADHLQQDPGINLGDVAYTLACRRGAFEHRLGVVCRDREEAGSALRQLTQADAGAPVSKQAPVALLFPGQGTQYVNMARGLYDHEPVFARELDRCAELFAVHLGEDLRTQVFAPADGVDAAAHKLEQTAITQPVMFAVEYSLAMLWRAWGVRPRAMAGHSIGEYVAACLAGVFSLEDAVRVVAARGRLVQAMPRGDMLAVFLPEQETTIWLDDDLCLAAVNSTALSVVSGSTQAIDGLERRLAAAGIAHRRLRTSHAFHSPFMEGAVGPLVDEFRKVTLNPPQIPFCSGVTGTWITDEQATSPEYWGAQLRQPVRFCDALDEFLADPSLVLLEVGPGETLSGFARQHRAWREGRTVAGSLRHPKDGRDDLEYVLQSLGTLWRAGAPVDWASFYRDERHGLVPLPTYAFQRQRYWVDPDSAAALRQPYASPETGASVDDYFYTAGWKRLPPREEKSNGAASAVWLVLGADLGLGRELAHFLRAENATVVTVHAGDDLRQHGDRSWSLNPTRREHYVRLIEFVAARKPQTIHIVHLWSLGCGPAEQLDEAQLDRARELGFDTLLALAQGIGDTHPPAPIAIDVLCRGVYSVTGDERLQPENAPLLGVSKVIPQEVADVTCRTLDITEADPFDPQPDALREVCAIIDRPTEDRELALRGRHWWVQEFDAVRLPTLADGQTRLRDRGVYLITGGLGGVGLALASYIARTVDSPVLGLLGRSAFPDEASWAEWLSCHDERDETGTLIRQLQHLREQGARIVILRADVTDFEQASRAVEQLRSQFGAVNGIIHAAGQPSQGLIMGKSHAEADVVLSAKTRGTLVLDRIFDGGDCDFILLCSSLASVLGGPGQSDYCGANAFLDLFAQWKQREAGVQVCAIGWDTWRDVGMAAGIAARFRDNAGPGVALTGHPLLQRLVQQSRESRTYVTTFSTADSWIIDEHRVMGHGLVPGTAYLELVRAAVAQQADGRVIEFNEVLFAMPVIVPDGQTRSVYTTIEQRDDRVRFTVRSRTDTKDAAVGWQEHVTGSVSFRNRDAEVMRDLDDVLRQCGRTDVIEAEDELKQRLKLGLVEEGGRIQFSFGPRWRRSLRRIHAGGTRLLATLTLENAFLADLDSYSLHPALLDLAGAAARIHAPDVYYMPLTYRSMQVFSGLTSTLYCYIELKESGDSSGETLTCDIEILDVEGRLLVRILDLTIKRINDIDDMLRRIEQSAAQRPGNNEGDGEAQAPGASTLSTLSSGMSVTDAVGAFSRILAAASLPEQVVVSSKDLTAMRRLAQAITPSLLTREVERIASHGGMHPRPDLATPYVAPATEMESAIAAVWQEVLGIERVGVDDDFFALGGHSLAAVQIGTKIKNQFGVELDLRGFFDRPTVASTAAALSEPRHKGDDIEEVIPVLRRDDLDGPDNLDLDDLSDAEVEARLQELLTSEMNEPGGTA